MALAPVTRIVVGTDGALRSADGRGGFGAPSLAREAMLAGGETIEHEYGPESETFHARPRGIRAAGSSMYYGAATRSQ